jgi:phosphatidate cytidylyltransferase
MLRARVITAFLLIAGLAGALFLLSGLEAAAVFAVIAALAAWEWAGFMKQDQPARVMFACVTLLFCWQAHVGGAEFFRLLWTLSTAFWFLLVPIWLRCGWNLRSNDLAGYATGLLLIVPTWAAMVALHQRGPLVLLAVLLLVWIADISAYFAGRRFGRTKLAPSISPGKTWAGVFGAIGGTALYAFILAVFGQAVLAVNPLLNLLLSVVCALMLTMLSVMGDLFESLMKRQAQLKDSSALLPGHGGVLDRIDSLTAALPVAALLMSWGSA